MEIMVQRAKQLPIPTPPIYLAIHVPDTNGKRDIGNYEKPITDLLVKMGIIPEDNDKVVREINIKWRGDIKQVLVCVEPWVP